MPEFNPLAMPEFDPPDSPTLQHLFDNFTDLPEWLDESCLFDGPIMPHVYFPSQVHADNKGLEQDPCIDAEFTSTLHIDTSNKLHTTENTIQPPIFVDGFHNVPGTSSEFIDVAALSPKFPKHSLEFHPFVAKETLDSNSGRGQKRERNLWTAEEHERFLLGHKIFGDRNCESISRDVATTRLHIQIASDAQKYYMRSSSDRSYTSKKKRTNIHDLTLDDVDYPYGSN